MKKIPQEVKKDIEEASLWTVDGEVKERIFSEEGDLSYAETYKSFHLFFNNEFGDEDFAYSKELDIAFMTHDGFDDLYYLIDSFV